MRKLSLKEIKTRLKIINPIVKIISKEYINSKTHLDCKCRTCGYEWKAIWNSLSKGIGCPKCSGKARPTIEEVKNNVKEIHPNIEILDNVYKNNRTSLKCHCLICGHVWKACYDNLINGKTDCPKCAKRLKPSIEEARKNILKVNPKIKILSDVYKNNASPLLCKCLICGHEWHSRYHDLMVNKSCPLCNASKGEKIIYQWLRDHNFNFRFQYKFKNCKHKLPLPFDFYLVNLNICIEFDGELHYKQINWERFNLNVQKERDKIKDEFCKENNIKLIRISYWEINNINTILKGALL